MLNRILFTILTFVAAFQAVAQEIEHDHSIHHAFIENKGQWEEPILLHQNKS